MKWRNRKKKKEIKHKKKTKEIDKYHVVSFSAQDVLNLMDIEALDIFITMYAEVVSSMKEEGIDHLTTFQKAVDFVKLNMEVKELKVDIMKAFVSIRLTHVSIFTDFIKIRTTTSIQPFISKC